MILSHSWWHKPIIPAFRRVNQKMYYEIEISVDYIVCLRLAWATYQKLVSVTTGTVSNKATKSKQ